MWPPLLTALPRSTRSADHGRLLGALSRRLSVPLSGMYMPGPGAHTRVFEGLRPHNCQRLATHFVNKITPPTVDSILPTGKRPLGIKPDRKLGERNPFCTDSLGFVPLSFVLKV